MGRRGKTDRVPKTRASNQWTEAAFWGFVRSGLRRISRRWPPLVQDALRAVRRPSQNKTNKLLKWEYQCSFCEGWFKQKEVQVDHIVPCGSLKNIDDLAGFFLRLFCEVDGLRVLCKTCHAQRTDPKFMSLRIKSDEEKLVMFREVSNTLKLARGLSAMMRVDLLAAAIEEHPQDLPVFLRWVWNPEATCNISWADLKQDCYVPERGRSEHIGFWLMMSRMRRRGLSREERAESIKEWKDCLCHYDQSLVLTAAAVLRKKVGWGLNLLHVNSALEMAKQTNQMLEETESELDLLER